MTSDGTTITNMSVPNVIFTLRAEDLSIAPDMDDDDDGTGLRVLVVEDDDALDGVSGIEEKGALVKVLVPVVGREEVIGEIGE